MSASDDAAAQPRKINQVSRPDKFARDRVEHLTRHTGESRLIDLLARAYLQGMKDVATVLKEKKP